MASSFNLFQSLYAILPVPLKYLSDSALDAEIIKIVRATWLRIRELYHCSPTKIMENKMILAAFSICKLTPPMHL